MVLSERKHEHFTDKTEVMCFVTLYLYNIIAIPCFISYFAIIPYHRQIFRYTMYYTQLTHTIILLRPHLTCRLLQRSLINLDLFFHPSYALRSIDWHKRILFDLLAWQTTNLRETIRCESLRNSFFLFQIAFLGINRVALSAIELAKILHLFFCI